MAKVASELGLQGQLLGGIVPTHGPEEPLMPDMCWLTETVLVARHRSMVPDAGALPPQGISLVSSQAPHGVHPPATPVSPSMFGARVPADLGRRARQLEWHLRNIFGKVRLSSRRQLRDKSLGPVSSF